MEIAGQCVLVLRKELRHLWRARTRATATGAFALATLFLFSFAGGLDGETLRGNAAGYLWVGLLLASTLALGESFRVETEHGALEMLLLLPVHPVAIFVGKALGNTLTLLLVGLTMVPFTVALFDAAPREGLSRLVLCIVAGAAAIAAPGTMHAALSSRARARDVLLPLLLFPLVLPCVVASTMATRLVITGDPMGQFGSWLSVTVGFAVVHWSLGALLFPLVVED
jgi:heme exporter protein B